MKNNTALSPKAQASLERVIAKFESGDLSPITHMALLQLDPSVPAAHWTLTNRVLAYAQSGELDWRGFNQWGEVGRAVKKGGRAVFILRPKTITKEDSDGEKKVRVVGFATLPVFPIDQTEGEELATSYKPVELPPLMDVAERLGVKVEYHPTTAAMARGLYAPSEKKIVLGTHDNRTFFHELAHAAHYATGMAQDADKAEKEVVAEFTAAVLSDLYGEDRTGNAWSYISAFANDPLVAIAKAISHIEKVLAVIVGEQLQPV